MTIRWSSVGVLNGEHLTSSGPGLASLRCKRFAIFRRAALSSVELSLPRARHSGRVSQGAMTRNVETLLHQADARVCRYHSMEQNHLSVSQQWD